MNTEEKFFKYTLVIRHIDKILKRSKMLIEYFSVLTVLLSAFKGSILSFNGASMPLSRRAQMSIFNLLVNVYEIPQQKIIIYKISAIIMIDRAMTLTNLEGSND